MAQIAYTSSDRIDLLEFFTHLWKSRLSILTFTVLGIVLAAYYAFTSTEEWTSKAQITPPKATQLGSYLEVQRAYYRFADTNEKLNLENILKEAYTNLIIMLSAADNKRRFLQDSAYFLQQSNQESNEFKKQNMLLKMVESDLQVKEINNGKNHLYDVSFTAETASNAQKILQSYIEKTNAGVLNKLFLDLHALIKARILTLENKANNVKKQTEQIHKNKMLLLEQAIVTANAANITEYTGRSTVAGNTIIDFSGSENMFLLGEKYLAAELKAMQTSPVIYPVAYYQTLDNIINLQKLLRIEPKGMAFEYTQKPLLPLVKEKPRRSLIIILGALLGGVLGVGNALVRFVISKRVVKK